MTWPYSCTFEKNIDLIESKSHFIMYLLDLEKHSSSKKCTEMLLQ